MREIPERDGYYIYILTCKDQYFYCGWTTNLVQRYTMHFQGKGAKYTRAHPPIAITYWETFPDESSARKREYEIKQMTRKQKEALLYKESCVKE